MTTKIEGMAPGMPRPSSAGPATAATRVGSSERSREPAGDSVKLSGEAAELATLERSLSETPAFDAAKVQSVRIALDTGTYKIDPLEIAARLTELEKALGV